MYKERLKKVRENNNLSQKQIAEILNKSRSVYATYETEFIIIPIKHLITLCDKFNMSLNYTFELTNTLKYDNTMQGFNLKLAGKRLKEFRKNNNISQRRLAIVLKCSPTTIAGYESGRYLIATPFLYTICKKYNISADYLLGKTNNSNI